MKQTVEVDPEVIAYRTVASLYAEEAFEHGVFASTLGALSGSFLGNLQAICEQNELLGDRTRPTDSFKSAVGQIACIKQLPRLLITASYQDIEEFANEVLNPFQGPSDEELRQAFGATPNRAEAFLIEQAKKQTENHDLFIGNPAGEVELPEMFTRVLPEAEEHFRLFARAARATILSTNGREYLVGSNNEVGESYIVLSPPFEAYAHSSVIDWDDDDTLVKTFKEKHSAFNTDEYLKVWVEIAHSDDLTPQSYKLTNDNTDQVGRQFANLLTQLTNIRHLATQ